MDGPSQLNVLATPRVAFVHDRRPLEGHNDLTLSEDFRGRMCRHRWWLRLRRHAHVLNRCVLQGGTTSEWDQRDRCGCCLLSHEGRQHFCLGERCKGECAGHRLTQLDEERKFRLMSSQCAIRLDTSCVQHEHHVSLGLHVGAQIDAGHAWWVRFEARLFRSIGDYSAPEGVCVA